jgi:hypothetical protein
VSFFEDREPPPPPPPDQVEYRSPPWSEMAPNVVPASVALDVVLLRTEDWAVWIGAGTATPEGLAFTVTVLGRRDEVQPDRMAPLFDGSGPDRPRFGVGFADGRKAVADRMRHARQRLTGDAATEISLAPRHGTGGRRRWSQSFWLWPLPPEGSLSFAIAWPEVGIDETVVEVDTAPLRAAAARAVELWPDDRPLPPADGSAGWLGYT